MELPTASGRNDGSVRGTRYFRCPPQHGLFVTPSQLEPHEGADDADVHDGDVEALAAWAAIENVFETEALTSAREGDRMLKHLQQAHPTAAAGAAKKPPVKPPGSPGLRPYPNYPNYPNRLHAIRARRATIPVTIATGALGGA